jgi:N-acetylneuraminic acid mutarotase
MTLLIKSLFIFSLLANKQVSDSSPNPTDSIFWLTKAPVPDSRYWCPAAGLIRDTIYLLGGRGDGGYANSVRTIYAYIPASDTWITNLPTLLTTRRAGGGGQVGHKIYVCGGRDSTQTTLNTCEEFDIDTKMVIQKANMPDGRWACAGSAIGDKVYIFGSENESDELLEYNTITDSWQIISPTTRPPGRGWNAVASAGGKLYACGGNHEGTVLNDCWEFDPISEMWTQKANMPGPRINHSAIGFDDDNIFVVGGASSGAGSGDTLVYLYTVSANSWFTETPIPAPRLWSMLAIHENWLYVLGGSDPASRQDSTVAGRIYPTGIYLTKIANPNIFMLSSPNPITDRATIAFTLCSRSSVKISIYNVTGKYIRNLVNSNYEKGKYSVTWNAEDNNNKKVANGIYFYNFTTPEFSITRKLILKRK